MKRFILPGPPGPGAMIRLYEKDYHYLVRVRRLKPGMCFDAVLPGGDETRVRVLSTVDNILIGECEGIPAQPPDSETGGLWPAAIPPIALFQGLPKGAKMDLIVRQAAEGEVSLVAPFLSEYSAAQKGGDYSGKLKRWERIVREARQQSGAIVETRLMPPCGFACLLDFWESKKKEYKKPLGIMLHQEPLEKGSFHSYLGNSYPGSSPDFTALAVGPEGGFSPGEVSLMLAAGFKPLLIGNSILRTETAALYGVAAIKTILAESEAWTPV